MNKVLRAKSTMLAASTLLAALVLSGCVGSNNTGGPDDWLMASPESKGLSTSALDSAAAKVGDIHSRYCFSVVKDGTLVYDNNYGKNKSNKSYPGFSLTKTFMAALIGIAETEGYLTVDDKISDWLDALPKSMNPDATIRHVMGQVAENTPLGSKFSYNSGAVINTLGKVISKATGMKSVDYAKQALLDPLNMQYTHWPGDGKGNLKAGFGITSSCRDVARLGRLLLDHGRWGGATLLTSDYVSDLTNPSYADANANYGYLTWLNWSNGKWRRPIVSGTDIMVKNAPTNVFMGTGFFGQLIIVIPDANVVVTTMGTTLELETLNTLQDVWDAIAPAVGL